MNQRIFQIELLGGPADGLRATAKSAPGRLIRLPSCPASRHGDRWGNHRSAGTHLAVYEMLWSTYGTDAAGRAIVHTSYDYVGTRPLRNNGGAKHPALRWLAAIVPARLRRWTGGMRAWLCIWLTPPRAESASMNQRRPVARRRPIKKS